MSEICSNILKHAVIVILHWLHTQKLGLPSFVKFCAVCCGSKKSPFLGFWPLQFTFGVTVLQLVHAVGVLVATLEAASEHLASIHAYTASQFKYAGNEGRYIKFIGHVRPVE